MAKPITSSNDKSAYIFNTAIPEKLDAINARLAKVDEERDSLLAALQADYDKTREKILNDHSETKAALTSKRDELEMTANPQAVLARLRAEMEQKFKAEMEAALQAQRDALRPGRRASKPATEVPQERLAYFYEILHGKHNPMGKEDIAASLGIKKDTPEYEELDAAINELVKDGYADKSGAGRGTKYTANKKKKFAAAA